MMQRIPVRMQESKAWKLVVTAAAALLLMLTALALDASPAFAAGTVTVGVQGQGSASGPGIDCNQSGGPDCSEFYADTRVCEFDPETRQEICFFVPPDVELTAGPDTNGYVLDGWTGCDAVSLRVCQMTVSTNRSVSALFRDAQAPSVGSLSPSSGVQRGSITISASAGDNSGSLNRVEFRVRGALIGTDTAAPYSASFNTASVPDGTATIRATAFDAAGNSAFTESSITIDNTAPTVNITGGPNGQTFGPGSTQTWTFSAGDATSGVASVQCSVVATGSPASFGACSGGSGSHSVSNRPDGSYTFSVRARDSGGLETTASRTFSIDATAPNTTITSGIADGARTNQTTLTWNFTSSETGSTFECRVYPAALTPPAFGACSAAGSHTAAGFAPGTYTFEVRATDAFGNSDGTSAKRTFTIDTTAPTVTDVTPAADATGVAVSGDITATFSEAMDASTLTGATFALTKQGAASSVAATVTYDSANRKVTLNPDASLDLDAIYTATLKSGADGAKDLAGNPLATDRVWSFTTEAAPDTTPPNTTITSGVADSTRTNRTTLTWGFASSEAGSSFGCRVYWTSSPAPAFGPCSGAGSHTAAGLTSGTYAFEVRATDAHGNLDGTPAKRTFTIDTTKPMVGSVTPRHLAKNISARTNVTAAFSEAMSAATVNRTTFKLVKKGTRTPVAARVSYSGNRATLNPSRNLTAGATYTATVTTGARDLAGNLLAVTKTWRFTVRR